MLSKKNSVLARIPSLNPTLATGAKEWFLGAHKLVRAEERPLHIREIGVENAYK